MNSERYLSDCIESVWRQNYKNIEHIIVDGKSTDGTLEIIHDNSDHISSWISETDRGMYDAINKGIQMATGDIVGILNSDDMFASADSVRSIVDCFENNQVDSVYGDLVYVDPENTQKIIRYWKGASYKRARFRYGWMPAHPTFYIRRDLIQQYGLYENHYYTAADYEFMARYLFLNKVSSHYVEAMLVKMRSGGLSNITVKSRFRANRRDYLAMKKNRIPFSFIVSILKPLQKIPQYKSAYAKQYTLANKEEAFFRFPVAYLPAD
jgi:glycosyltransferase